MSRWAFSLRGLLIGASLFCAPTVLVAQPEHAGEPAHAAPHAAGSHDGPDAHHGHSDPSEHFNFFDIGYKKKDLYGGKVGDGKQGDQPLPAGEPEEPMGAPFVLMLVNFGILLFLLAKYGGPPARRMAEERHDQIRGALEEAAKLRDAAKAKLAEYSTKLASAQAEMDAMLTSMRADAEAEKQRILAAAEAQAAAMKRDAELRIAAEIQRARALLTREVAVAAAGAAEKILQERTTPADHTTLVDSFVTGMASASQGAV